MLTAAISVCPAERVGDERVDAVAAAAAAPAEVPSPVGDTANNEVALHDRQDVRRGATRRRGVAAAAGRVTAAGSRRRRGAGRRRGGLAVAGPAAGAAPRRLRLRQMSQSDAGRRCRRYCVGGVRQHRTAVLLIASCSHLPPYTPPPVNHCPPRAVVISFRFHQNRLSGLGAVGSKFAHCIWLTQQLVLPYTGTNRDR